MRQIDPRSTVEFARKKKTQAEICQRVFFNHIIGLASFSAECIGEMEANTPDYLNAG